VRGKADDAGGFERAGELAGGEDGLMEGFGGLVVGDEDEGWGRGCLDEEREIEGTRGEGEAGDAAAALSVLEVTTGSVEGVGVFEVCEEVADEGENHRYLPVYQSSAMKRTRAYFHEMKSARKCLAGNLSAR
jgi:hypothetical protein